MKVEQVVATPYADDARLCAYIAARSSDPLTGTQVSRLTDHTGASVGYVVYQIEKEVLAARLNFFVDLHHVSPLSPVDRVEAEQAAIRVVCDRLSLSLGGSRRHKTYVHLGAKPEDPDGARLWRRLETSVFARTAHKPGVHFLGGATWRAQVSTARNWKFTDRER